MARLGWVFSIFLLCAGLVHIDAGAQTQSPPAIVAKLYVEQPQIRAGVAFKIKVELENVSDHTVLVGRLISQISNYPIGIDFKLQDENGKEFIQPGAGFVDSPRYADFCTDNGLLKWWAPLDPQSFWGTFTVGRFDQVPVGHYRLTGRYHSHGSPGSNEGFFCSSNVPAFQGVIETMPIAIEVVR